MADPTGTATLSKSGNVLTLTVQHSNLDVTETVSVTLTNGAGKTAVVTDDAVFEGDAAVTSSALGLTYTYDAAASDADTSVFRAPLS